MSLSLSMLRFLRLLPAGHRMIAAHGSSGKPTAPYWYYSLSPAASAAAMPGDTGTVRRTRPTVNSFRLDILLRVRRPRPSSIVWIRPHETIALHCLFYVLSYWLEQGSLLHSRMQGQVRMRFPLRVFFSRSPPSISPAQQRAVALLCLCFCLSLNSSIHISTRLSSLSCHTALLDRDFMSALGCGGAQLDCAPLLPVTPDIPWAAYGPETRGNFLRSWDPSPREYPRRRAAPSATPGMLLVPRNPCRAARHFLLGSLAPTLPCLLQPSVARHSSCRTFLEHNLTLLLF